MAHADRPLAILVLPDQLVIAHLDHVATNFHMEAIFVPTQLLHHLTGFRVLHESQVDVHKLFVLQYGVRKRRRSVAFEFFVPSPWWLGIEAGRRFWPAPIR